MIILAITIVNSTPQIFKTKIIILHFKEDVDVNKSEIYNILHLADNCIKYMYLI